ncbi:hypothetical protein [Butyrivibrio sp. AC2005]|uniref:hypothetical protein n=1 Tax=Butyrivibrio sp. AC2005 TaxID=1280672 RepID=UPI0003FFA81B|nr:hypothetical protein [Butyrivibrio sp. AC2005]
MAGGQKKGEEIIIIDSELLKQVNISTNGYAVLASGVFDKHNANGVSEHELYGPGSYLHIFSQNNKLVIAQDFLGSWGLYLYKKDNYFAISNSILDLISYLSNKVELTLNYDYANELILSPLSSRAYKETIVNEIELLDKDVRVIIDIDKKRLELEHIDYGETSLGIDTFEGMQQLDKWALKWGRIVNGLTKKTDQIQFDLSGGFDTRMVLALLLGNGVDINRIRVNSMEDGLHTHSEDYVIAKKIADDFGFKLNSRKLRMDSRPYTAEESLAISTRVKMTTHKEFCYPVRKYKYKRYNISGGGGEMIRGQYGCTEAQFIEKETRAADRFSEPLCSNLKESCKRLYHRSFKALREKYGSSKWSSDGIMYYVNTRCRTHFGRVNAEGFFANRYTLAPLMDPDLLKLRISTDECKDPNLLMAIIFTRYCDKLLNYEFEGGRSIDAGTIEYARSLNNRFPFHRDTSDDVEIDVVTMDESVIPEPDTSASWKEIDDILLKRFKSDEVKEIFSKYFDMEIYEYALKNAREKEYFPLREVYAVMGIVEVLKLINTSRE